MTHSHFWTELAWTDFDTLDMERMIAVLPLAAVEQHGPHLPLGVDTFIRLADPMYYGGSRSAAEEAVARIAASARGLIVFGRVRDGVFLDPSQIEVPGPLREIAYVVSQREFRLDISSTELRAAGDDSRD